MKKQDEWIVVGSSPSAGDWLPRVRGEHPDAAIVAANRGIELFANESPPDVYFIGAEAGVVAEDAEDARTAQVNGARIVSLARSAEILHELKLDFVDQFLEIEVGCWRPWKFIPGKYTAAQLSGLFCLQYAANKSPASIHCVGMEGYADRDHYFDGSPDSKAAEEERHTSVIIEPFTQAVINACPNIDFCFYGELVYSLSGENVRCVSSFSSDGEDSPPAVSPTLKTEEPTS